MKRQLKTWMLAALLLLAACNSQNHPEDAQNLNSNALPSIIGGELAKPNEFPFVVNLWLDSPSDLFTGHLCGGSLIHPKWVLTAAHCVLQDATDKSLGTVKLKELSLFLGSLQASGQGGKTLSPKRIAIHPSFQWPSYDVALIELSEPVLTVNPILLNQNTDLSELANQNATVIGWGLMDEFGRIESPVLRKVTLPLVSRKTCESDSYVQKSNWRIGPDMICARTNWGKNASCGGDSGGPLFQPSTAGFVQIGIVSWGSACNLLKLGQQADIEVYSDVSTVYSWIQNIIH